MKVNCMKRMWSKMAYSLTMLGIAGSASLGMAALYGDVSSIMSSYSGANPCLTAGTVIEFTIRLGDTDNTTGLGLGMALSKGFIESMGGAIDAEDTPGGGLTMVITLRAADERYAIGEPLSEEDARACATALDADMWDVTAAASGVMLPLSVDESRDGELGRFADAESDTAVAGDMAAADEHTDVADVTAAEKEE